MLPSTVPQKTLTRRPSAKSEPQRETRRLRDLRGVGARIEADLRQLGVDSVRELARRDGASLYEALCDLTKSRQDPCVLDTFRCAVAQARNSKLPVEQCNWWWWSRQRKAAKNH
jgi:Pathogenicity locus